MKLTSYFLLILILLLQLMIPRYAQCSLDSIMDTKIKEALNGLGNISCTSIFSSGKLSSCPAANVHIGMVVTSCACGYGCGSWDIQGETTCHCQCSTIDWTTSHCCHLT
ncbi:resistin-like beta [Felis catus]|uniref:resistin-like beta n=1 Tax=Felis catus TaxID=9685 RepID=UPI001D19BB14|nr:resistin-like beta [Felis catus]